MDVFERVREVNAGARLTPEQISTARSRLLAGMDERTAAARRRAARRPMYLIAGGVVGVAAVTATALVVSHSAAPTPRVEAVPAPSASPVPTAPATPEPAPSPGTGAGTGVVEPYPGTTPRAGQYLSVETTEDDLWYRGPYASLYQWPNRPKDQKPISAAIMRSHRRSYVPADPTGDWIFRTGPDNERVASYSDDPGPGDRVDWDNMLPVQPDVREQARSAAESASSIEPFTRYPSDPQALIGYLRDDILASGASEDTVQDGITNNLLETLMVNYAPAQTRKTFLAALASRAEQLRVDGAVVTYRVRITEFGLPSTITISIDTTTGWTTDYTEKWDRIEGSGPDMAPADVPDIHRTFQVSIVDSLP